MTFWRRRRKVTGSKSAEQLRGEHLRLWTTHEGVLVLTMIGADEIRRLDHSRIHAAVEASIGTYESGSRPLQAVHFGTSAYDNDPRALFDIPEMRSWCQALYGNIPFLFSILDAPTIDWFLPAVAEIEVTNREVGKVAFQYRPESIERILAQMQSAQEVLFRRLAKSPEDYETLWAQSVERLRAAL